MVTHEPIFCHATCSKTLECLRPRPSSSNISYASCKIGMKYSKSSESKSVYSVLCTYVWMSDNSPKNQLTQKPTYQSCDQLTQIDWSTHPSFCSSPKFKDTSPKCYRLGEYFGNLFLALIYNFY